MTDRLDKLRALRADYEHAVAARVPGAAPRRMTDFNGGVIEDAEQEAVRWLDLFIAAEEGRPREEN